MTCLDTADPSQSVAVRNQTITALQALALMNNPAMVRHAAFIAERVAQEADWSARASGPGLCISAQPFTER